MKICKVKITKQFNAGVCRNIYPTGYNPEVMNVIAYDENPLSEGDNVGYCIAIVKDDFTFTRDMVQIDRSKAETFIDARAAIYEKAEHQDKFKNSKKGALTRDGIA